MMKTFVFTPAFCKWKLLKSCLEHIYLNPPENVTHVVIDNHYPVEKDQNRKNIKKLCQDFGCLYIDSKRDLGLHEGLNHALNIVDAKKCDLFIGVDPDDRPSPGFDKALKTCMDLDPSIAVLGLNFWVIDQRFKEGKLKERTLGPYTLWDHPSVEMWNITAMRLDFILESGGFKQPWAYYGGIEAALFHEYARRGMKLSYLKDFRSDAAPLDREDRELFDPQYRQWKTDHVGNKFPGSFEEYLAKT